MGVLIRTGSGIGRRRRISGRISATGEDIGFVRLGSPMACPPSFSPSWQPAPPLGDYAAAVLSQFPRIGKCERGHPARVLVEDQRAGDRRLGALAAVLALAEPAVDADRRAFGFLQIHAGGVDQAGGMADFTPC